MNKSVSGRVPWLLSAAAAALARGCGVSRRELEEMLDVLLEEE